MSHSKTNTGQKTGKNKKQYYSVLTNGGSGGDEPTSKASSKSSGNGTSSKADSSGFGNEQEMCLICTEPIRIASLSPCNHKVCHICSFRNVALYKKHQCLVCRTETPKLIFTENLSLNKFDDINNSQLIPAFKNDNGVRYTSERAKNATLKLMEYTCPIATCDHHGVQMNSFKDLNHHVKDVHAKFYCELCAKFKKAFIGELKLYTKKQLHQHQTKGDTIGFKGHPECKFCSNKRFYSDDELYVHMRDHHEKCHICQQIDPNNPQYFRNYEHLAQHFKSAHYVCNVQSCLDQKFVVFRDEFDLQTHMAKEHSGIYGNNILLSTNTFNNQLYTVSGGNSSKKKVKSKEPSSQENYELKKKRLEERARHYLNYAQDKIDRFLAANIEYSDSKITSTQLVDRYHEIFKDSKDVDYSLLIYELAGLFPAKSNLRKDLEVINKPQLELREQEEKFPELPGITKTMNHTTWGMSNMPKSKTKLKVGQNSNDHSPALPGYESPLFPSLPGYESRSSSRGSATSYTSTSSSSNIKTRGISSNSSPINGYSIPGYNPLPTTTKAKKNKNAWGTSQVPPPAKLQGSSSTPALASSLNTNSSSNVASASYSSLSAALNPTVVRKSTNTILDSNLCPSLPKDPPKKVIPRVNPIGSPSATWGNGLSVHSSPAPSSNSSHLDIMSAGVKTVKKGKKGSKVVYQFGR